MTKLSIKDETEMSISTFQASRDEIEVNIYQIEFLKKCLKMNGKSYGRQ